MKMKYFYTTNFDNAVMHNISVTTSANDTSIILTREGVLLALASKVVRVIRLNDTGLPFMIIAKHMDTNVKQPAL